MMNRTRDYYRKQRKRIIRKKRRHMSRCGFVKGKPDGVFAKNKFHCPMICRQRKTTPKAGAYRYGDHKHNWRPRDVRAICRMKEQVAEWYDELKD